MWWEKERPKACRATARPRNLCVGVDGAYSILTPTLYPLPAARSSAVPELTLGLMVVYFLGTKTKFASRVIRTCAVHRFWFRSCSPQPSPSPLLFSFFFRRVSWSIFHAYVGVAGGWMSGVCETGKEKTEGRNSKKQF